ncbi:MAG: 4Fe-4S dicluster domain-containing protein, partial [Deltaproteobacteria bacterium]|nr:4Fe-4S dicluster domain-containing protein [Deltaproteobacteria bacterium]
LLVIAEVNPVYAAPELAPALIGVRDTLCLTHEASETSARARWTVALAHPLEAWGDARAYDGTVSLIQPMIRPLHPSVSLAEMLAAFAGEEQPDAHRLLLEQHRVAAPDDLGWRAALRRGFLENTELPAVEVTATEHDAEPAPASGYDLSFDASPVYDGRFAGNAWLQELPRPQEKLTWGNAAIASPATARALGADHGDVVRIKRNGAVAELPLFVLPGHADGCVSLELGYGRRAGGPIAEGVGVDVYPLRPYGRGFVTGAVIARTGATAEMAVTQQHFGQDHRDVAPAASLAWYRQHPRFTDHMWGPTATMLPVVEMEPRLQWAMTIDTMLCTGCSSCVIACQAENNIPVVGRRGVVRNRVMHWLRIDTYRAEDEGDVEVVNQPMLCQHCEKAPCEYVCPVYATQHSPDGLNEMVYNRCIGTRFCSNNCPYKVRRFNWFDFTGGSRGTTLALQHNPTVTVRARGVMEKCTYCVQRIRAAEITARVEHREIRPGEVVTACQQACPTGAIKFGALQHAGTDMVTWREEPRHYAVLHHLGTRPRTVYLAKITNPRPEKP